jgi:HSP20 family protein
MSKLPYNSRPNAETPVYFDDFLTRDLWRATTRLRTLRMVPLPATNIVETLDALVIELIAPGVSHEDIALRQTDRGLEVRFDSQMDQSFEPIGNRQVWRHEYLPGSFRRSFDLNAEALELDNVLLSSENGVVRLEIPKRDELRGMLMAPQPFSLN